MKLFSVTAMPRTRSTLTKMCKQNQIQWISMHWFRILEEVKMEEKRRSKKKKRKMTL
jgi:hypothetical protein